jgi:hypothetical protein
MLMSSVCMYCLCWREEGEKGIGVAAREGSQNVAVDSGQETSKDGDS